MLPGAQNLVSAVLNSLLSPGFWLVALAVLCVALAMSPLAVAIGGYFWDVYLYPTLHGA